MNGVILLSARATRRVAPIKIIEIIFSYVNYLKGVTYHPAPLAPSWKILINLLNTLYSPPPKWFAVDVFEEDATGGLLGFGEYYTVVWLIIRNFYLSWTVFITARVVDQIVNGILYIIISVLNSPFYESLQGESLLIQFVFTFRCHLCDWHFLHCISQLLSISTSQSPTSIQIVLALSIISLFVKRGCCDSWITFWQKLPRYICSYPQASVYVKFNSKQSLKRGKYIFLIWYDIQSVRSQASLSDDTSRWTIFLSSAPYMVINCPRAVKIPQLSSNRYREPDPWSSVCHWSQYSQHALEQPRCLSTFKIVDSPENGQDICNIIKR